MPGTVRYCTMGEIIRAQEQGAAVLARLVDENDRKVRKGTLIERAAKEEHGFGTPGYWAVVKRNKDELDEQIEDEVYSVFGCYTGVNLWTAEGYSGNMDLMAVCRPGMHNLGDMSSSNAEVLQKLMVGERNGAIAKVPR